MDRLETVEKLKEKSGAGYEEAKQALEVSEWNILDAIILLEKNGKVKPELPQPVIYTTKKEEEKPKKKRKGFFSRIKNRYFEVSKKGENIIRLPVWLFVLLMLSNTICQMLVPFAYYSGIFIAAFIILLGLFTGCEFAFKEKQAYSEDSEKTE